MDTITKDLKQAAKEFLRLASSGKVREAYQLYIADDFRHHNAYFKGDRQSLMTAMQENAAKTPDQVFKIHRTLQDGEFVAVHSHVRQKSDDPGVAVVHIFRFKDDRVVELWDVVQPMPKDKINENGMF